MEDCEALQMEARSVTPIEHARAILRGVRARGANRILVACSGGKESRACLDFAVAEFGAANVECFFMALVEGLESVEAPVHATLARYPGVKLHRVPHWLLSHYLREATLMPHQTAAATMRKQKLVDVERAVRAKTGIEWIAWGWRANDSVTRRVLLKRHAPDGVWPETHRVFPIADWSTKDVVGYLKGRGIALPPRFGAKTLNGPSGFDLTASCLRYLREHYPRDFAKVKAVFPFCEIVLERERFFPKPKEA